jgi:hypothetical protein
MLRVLIVHCLEGAHLHYVKGAHFVHAERLLIFHCLGAHFAQGGGCSVGTVWMVLIFNRWALYSFFILWRAPILYSLEVLTFHCMEGARFLSGECSAFTVWRVFILHCLESAYFALCGGAHFALS